MAAASSPPSHRLLPPIPSSSGGRRRSRGAWQQQGQEEQEERQDPIPPPLFPVDPASPFVLTDANAGLFGAVLYNWTWQGCRDCRMVLAAPGVYPIDEAREGV